MELRTVCYNCFQPHEGDGPCPSCGFDLAEHLQKYPVALRPGTVLNERYVTGRVLGQGGFGITYLAFDTQLSAQVAIKEFMPGEIATRIDGATVSVMSADKTEEFGYGADRFLEEARTLAKFSGNPNIAGVSSYFQENDTSYFVMEYIEGVSFKTYIGNHGGTVGVDDALNVMIPVLRALAAVHREGFIHRDVTPDNIYISKDGNVKLLDFGSARYSIGDKSKSLDVILKVGYAPKEQYIRRGRQGPYTDVYSCAACFYAALTGYLPPESLERLDHDTLVPVSQAGIGIPEYLDKAILKGLAVQPEDRFQTAEEFLAAIESQTVVEVPAAAPAQTPAAAPPSKKKTGLFIGVAAACLVLAIGMGMILGGGRGGSGGDSPGGILNGGGNDGPPVTIAGQEFNQNSKGISINNAAITNEDIQTILSMPHLENLFINNCQVEDYSFLAQLDLVEIGFTPQSAEDFAYLANMKNLVRIYCDQNSLPGGLEDFSTLSGLTSLQRFSLSINYVESLSGLENLTELREFQLYGSGNSSYSNITDLTPLSGLTKLETVSMNVGDLESLHGLENLTELRSLSLLNYGSSKIHSLTDLTPLSGMTRLESLRLTMGPAEDLHGLENLTAMQTLELKSYGNGVYLKNLDALSGMTGMQSLRIYSDSGNNAPPLDIQGLSGMTELTELHLSCPPKDLAPLRGLAKLATLELTGSCGPGGYASLAPLTDLQQLTSLHINLTGEVTDLSPLGELSELRELQILGSNNQDANFPFADMTAFGKMSKLTSLYISAFGPYNGPGMGSLAPLANLTELKSLTIYTLNAEKLDRSPVAHVPSVTIQ